MTPVVRGTPKGVLLALALVFASPHPARAQTAPPPLPMPLTNNAVAALERGPGAGLYTMLGVDSTKRWSGITRRAFHLPRGATAWRELPSVPGPLGRLASLAFGVKGRVVVIGGYSVDSAGAERSLPNVDIWDPARRVWRSGAPTPVAVDDAVGGVWRDSIIVLVTGWHDTDNVTDVQLYDVVRDRWMRGTRFPGVPVFGGSGTVSGDFVLVVDGARRSGGAVKYTLASQSWLGRIDPRDPTRIAWDTLPTHPGPARYRAAAAGCGTRGLWLFGGTDNPYNYDGIGYDRRPSEPLGELLTLDPVARTWKATPNWYAATMDHRGLLLHRNRALIVGGMRASQAVSRSIEAWRQPCLVRGR